MQFGGFPAPPGAGGNVGGFPAPGGGQPQQMQKTTGGKPRINKNLGAKDPLLKKGHGAVFRNNHSKENASTPPAQRVFQLTVLTLFPFLVYVVILFVTTFQFYHSPAGVTLSFCIVAGLCVMQYLLYEHCTRKKVGKWKKWVGLFAAFCAFLGFLIGMAIHYKYMLYYYKYTNMMKYSNVAASQPALQFEDAGSLLFTEGTTVDRTRAVGYRHIRSQQTLCVAPVVDGQMSPTDPIVFFAVGVNCCGWRASFTCDDAAKGGTRGGLLMLQPDQLVSPAMEFMVNEQFDFEAFEDAIDLQKSVFAVSAAKHHRLVRWVKDPTTELDNYRKRGLEAALLSCAVFFICAACFIASDVVQEGNRQAKAAKEFIKGGGGPPGGGTPDLA